MPVSVLVAVDKTGNKLTQSRAAATTAFLPKKKTYYSSPAISRFPFMNKFTKSRVVTFMVFSLMRRPTKQ